MQVLDMAGKGSTCRDDHPIHRGHWDMPLLTPKNLPCHAGDRNARHPGEYIILHTLTVIYLPITVYHGL